MNDQNQSQIKMATISPSYIYMYTGLHRGGNAPPRLWKPLNCFNTLVSHCPPKF